MKKKMFCLLVCVLLFWTAVSCDLLSVFNPTPDSAQELYDRIDKKMEALKSYKQDLTVDMTVFVNGYEMESRSTGYCILNNNVDGGYYYYQETTTKIKVKELSLNETQKNIEAYYGGNYFIFNSDGESSQKLYSPMTPEEAKEYIADSDLMDTVDLIKDCTNQSFAKREDGTWELSCSGYTKVAIEKIISEFGMDDGILSAEIMDMQLFMLADENYFAKQLKMDFVFEEAEKLPFVSITSDFSQYNEAEAVTDSLKTEDYTEVDDIKILDDIEDMLNDRMESKEGEFTLELEELVKDSGGNVLSSYKEDNSVTFGEGDSGYFYDIDAVINNVKYDISYKNGVQAVITGGSAQNNAQTEQEAKDWIKSLIASVEYNPIAVTAVDDRGYGIYKLTCANADTEVYESYFAGMNGKLTSVDQTIALTVKDGSISNISVTVIAKGNITSYGNITLKLTKSLEFE